MANFSLRAKSLFALALAFLVVLIPAALGSWVVWQGLRQHFGGEMAQNLTHLARERLLAPVARDFTISRVLAESELTRQWLQHENDPELKSLFFRNAESARQALQDQAYFIASRNGQYYFSDASAPAPQEPRYILSPDNPDDAWFYRLLHGNGEPNINVNTDTQLGLTRVWINIPILAENGDEILGLTGASMDLSRLLNELTANSGPGVTPMVLDNAGAIQVHPDPQRIAYNRAAHEAASHALLSNDVAPDDQTALLDALERARRQPNTTVALALTLDGRPQQIAISYLPDLDWFVVTAVDPKAAHVVHPSLLWGMLAGFSLLMVLLFVGFGFGVERLVLRPIRRLQQSAHAIARGQYDVSLPPPSNDEIGDLSRSFGEMANQVQRHTSELERRVRDRTRELEAANAAMAQAQKKIGASIDYASLIQRATLPTRQLTQSLGPNHFVIWRPRDVVGGDFYIFYADGQNCLLGIIDCAGHGVPGALMTMLARAAVDLAIHECGPTNPAVLLRKISQAMLAMLADSQLPRGLATTADAGLVYVDRERRRLRYAGARLSLYASRGEQLQEWPGTRCSLGDPRVVNAEYLAHEIPLEPGTTYYLTTDGFLDQSGGEHGYGFGNRRFHELLRRTAHLPLEEQASAFSQALEQYQGDRPQRDDITLLSFRFDNPTPSDP